MWIPFIGPGLFLAWARLARPSARWLKPIELLSILLISGTLLGYVIPANYRAIGPLSLALTAGTLALVFVATGRARRRAHADLGREFVLTAVMGGFLVHSLADGAALFSFSGPETVVLGPAIALDRFAVGFFVWTMLYPRYGGKVAFSMLALMSLVTVAGYNLMTYVTQAVGDPVIIGCVQSVLAGLVLFLAIRHKDHHPKDHHKDHKDHHPDDADNGVSRSVRYSHRAGDFRLGTCPTSAQVWSFCFLLFVFGLT